MKVLDQDELIEFRAHIRQACLFLALCWDHLREAEGIAGTAIETEDIQGMTSNLPLDPTSTNEITDEDIDTLLEVKL